MINVDHGHYHDPYDSEIPLIHIMLPGSRGWSIHLDIITFYFLLKLLSGVDDLKL